MHTIDIKQLRTYINLSFKINEAEGIFEWCNFFDEFLKDQKYYRCEQLLLEVKRYPVRNKIVSHNSINTSPSLCLSCRARIRFAEGQLNQRKATNLQKIDERVKRQEKAKRCFEESLKLYNKLILTIKKNQNEKDLSITGISFKSQIDITNIDIAKCYYQLGKLYFEQGDYITTIINYKNALKLHNDLYKNQDDSDDLIRILISLGETSYVISEFKKAVNYFERAMLIAKANKDSTFVGSIKHHFGLLLIQQGQFGKAKVSFNDALNIFEMTDDVKGISEAYFQLGIIYYNQKQYDAAKIQFEKSNENAFKTGHHVLKAALQHQWAIIYSEEGDLQKAEEHYNNALKCWESIGNRYEEAKTRYQMGKLYRDWSLISKAESYLLKSLSISHEIGDKTGETWGYYELGILCMERNRFYQARKYLTHCYDTAIDIKNVNAQGSSLLQLGILFQLENDAIKARSYFMKSLAIRKKAKDKIGVAESLCQLGVVDQSQKRYCSARRLFSESLSVSQECGDLGTISMVQFYMGRLNWEIGNFKKSQESFELALKFCEDDHLLSEINLHLEMLKKNKYPC